MEEPKEQKTKFQVSDRRFWANPEEPIEEVPSESRFPSYVEELKARTEAAEEKLKERLAELDSENQAFRERFQREAERRLDRQRLDLIEAFLEVLDNFERALDTEDSGTPESFRQGVALNLDLFRSKLAALGVEPLETMGEVFDPENAEAVSTMTVEDAAQDGRVVAVVQQGYKLGDRLLRPARVVVGCAPAPTED